MGFWKQAGQVLAGSPGSALSEGDRQEAMKKQTEAAQQAQDAQLAAMKEYQQEMRSASIRGSDLMKGAGGRQQEYLQQYGAQGYQAMGQGFDRGRADLSGGYAAGRGAYGQMAGMGAIDTYQTQAPGRMAGMYQQQMGPSRAEQFSERGVNIQEDPGYQYRLQEGEKAINRSAAARGGRGGGETLKALQQHGQQLASQEYGAAFNRQMGMDQAEMARRQQRMNMGSMADQMQMQQQIDMAGRSDRAALTAQSHQMQGLGAMGQSYTQQGQQMSNLATSQGMAQYGHQMGMGQQLGQIDYNTAAAMAGLEMQGAGAATQMGMQGMGIYGQTVPYAGAQEALSGHSWEQMNPKIGEALQTWGTIYGAKGGGGQGGGGQGGGGGAAPNTGGGVV